MLTRNTTNSNRFDQVQATLVSMLLANKSIDEMVNLLSQAVGQTVVVANMAGVVLAGQAAPELEKQLPKFINHWSARTETVSPRQLQIQAAQFNLVVSPLLLEQEMIGFLVTTTEADEQNIDVLKHNQHIISLALLRFQATREMVTQQKQELLNNLLMSDQRPRRHLVDQAQSLGWQLEEKSIAILLQFWATQTKSTQVGEQFHQILHQVFDKYCPESVIAASPDGFIILPHLPETVADRQEQVKSLLEKLVAAIKAAKIKDGYSLACGGFQSGLDGLRQSYQEARQALDVGTRLEMHRPIWFEEIYLYLLLERSGRNDEVRDWVQRTLGPLAEYDRRNKTEMLQTLEAYFDSNQTLQEAAHLLHVHPNTLKYRLGRIEQILDQDPFKGENQLRFYLATKMARLLK